ncbi:MAG: sigma-54-dependent Fis family transcriptional regulator [Oligoflexales bacterium]|nr:sigma-54-dependent Fis family transcriptional regulator [Oligoflexales bacterium]
MEAIKGRVVIVDDDAAILSLLKGYLSMEGYDVICFPSSMEALQSLVEVDIVCEKIIVDVVVCDLKMPKMGGLEFIQKLLVARPELPIILMTAFGCVETAVEAMKKGAFNYIIKPLKPLEVLLSIERALNYRKLSSDNKFLRKVISSYHKIGNIIGKSKEIQSVFELIRRVSQVNANVLITGESGTGKELVARAIHDKGPRSAKPFVAINCTAIPETLLESELFGHAKGAFTGAIQRKRGLFEEAEGGTIFLDEIGDMNLSLQAKLLRVIQEKQVRALGENVARDLDVRIIAATHKNLRVEMKENRFREDLYYRLCVIPIIVPSLRERTEDIPFLADYFLKKYTTINHTKVMGFTKKAIEKLSHLRWEGNVRELENTIERASILCSGFYIDETDIPSSSLESEEDLFQTVTCDFPTMKELERRYVQAVLDKTGNHKDKAAQILGLNRRTLLRKEKEYSLCLGAIP